MSKGNGGTLTNSSTQKAENKREFQKLFDNEITKNSISFYDELSGGYLIVQYGHQLKNGMNDVEYKAASILAQNGYRVILTPEGDGKIGSISVTRNKKGNKTYVDGKINTQTYEQHTPTTLNQQKGVLSSLMHARYKGADIALIYDHNNILHRNDIQKGIDNYNNLNMSNKSDFKAIIVVNAKKEIHDWYL